MSITMPVSLRHSLRAVATVSALYAPGVALAADDAAAADQTIIVNGERVPVNPYVDPAAPYKVDRSASTRFTEPLADTPKSITVIPQQVIQDLGAQSFRDLVRTQPGITLGTGEGGNAFGDRIFIRGFDARNDVYIDGLRDPGVTSREVFAVEQIEIVKGPSSTFGGRGTTGGAVSLISKSPLPANLAKFEATGGTDATRRFTADINRKLADNVQVRINGLWHDADVAGRDYVWSRRWGVAASLAVQPTANLDINLDYYHLSTEGMADWGVPFDARSQRPFDVPRGNFYGVLGRDFLKGRADIGTGRLVWRASDNIKLSSRLRYGSNLNSYIASAPEGPVITNPDPAQWTVRANPKNRNATSQTWANVNDLTMDFDTGGLHHTLVVGTELTREAISNKPFAFASSETVGAIIVPAQIILQPIFNPNPNIPFTQFPTLSGARTDTEISTKAVYILDTIDIGDTLKLSGGLRYDDYTVRSTSFTAAGARTDLRNDSDFLNWNAGLVWKPVAPLSLYVSAATSSNPSGEQSDGSGISYGGLGPQTANLDPERNRSYEAGVKYQAGEGGHLLLTAAVFRTDKTNARLTDPLTGLQVLAGNQRVTGFEVGAQGNLTPRLSLFGGYTYLDAKVRPTVSPPQAGGVFPNIPKHSLAMLATWRVFDALTIGGQANYNSERFGGAAIAGSATLPAYWRFDATARVKLSGKAELQLNVLNLTNKTYYDAIYRSGTPFAYVAPGRSALLTLRYAL
ncbi:TonB-dependent receptor [Sandarakinorhabdus sp. DWP1-3-1]|uniref:TonB-dependent receptor n=1 Tax=Sandarakinorhabdus sp. DWP1-3-1 TaxID=2804627 RepID=UPI003CF3EA91